MGDKIYKRLSTNFFIVMLLTTATLLHRDVYAIKLFGARITGFEIVVGLFIIFELYRIRGNLLKEISSLYYSMDVLSRVLVVATLLLGVSGFISIIYLSSKGQIYNLSTAVVDSVRYIMFASLFFFLRVRLRHVGARDFFYRIWVYITILVVLIGIFQALAVQDISFFKGLFYWENIRGNGTRIASVFRWQGPLVLFLGMSLPLIAAEGMTSRNKKEFILYICLFAGGLINLLFSGSRSSLLILPFSLLPFIIIKQKKIFKILIIGFIVSIIIYFMFFSNYISVTKMINRLSLDYILSGARVRVWSKGLTVWKNSPIFGFGPAQYTNYAKHSAHNTYLEILFERGLIGFTVLIVYMGAILRMIYSYLKEWRYYRNKGRVLAVSFGIINIFIYQITASAITYRYVWLFLAFAFATYGADKINDEQKIEDLS